MLRDAARVLFFGSLPFGVLGIGILLFLRYRYNRYIPFRHDDFVRLEEVPGTVRNNRLIFFATVNLAVVLLAGSLLAYTAGKVEESLVAFTIGGLLVVFPFIIFQRRMGRPLFRKCRNGKSDPGK